MGLPKLDLPGFSNASPARFDPGLRYKRHVRDVLVRIGSTISIWILALVSYWFEVIRTDHFIGVSLLDLAIVLLGLAGLPAYKRINDRKTYLRGGGVSRVNIETQKDNKWLINRMFY